uniref:mitogen-activated protein kinase kinase n=1 Tax=Leptinotarsa decemlineata TaxID=7539 RepID=A0A0M4N067_LEPDE|nr:MAP2K7 [Leptinotarsa decemlineata]
MSGSGNVGLPPNRPRLSLGLNSNSRSPIMSRPRNLTFTTKQNDDQDTDRKLREIMQISGDLTMDGILFKTDIKEMEHIEELGNGTCGHVVKMRHKPSNKIIAVKQMRRSGNSEENKRIIMDIEVVLKSHDCKYIVQCLGCFITESEVWICMELMDTCFDKLLKRFKQPVPEEVLGKVTVATVEALSYLKDTHGVIHRDVKPSNILLDTKGNVKLCDFGISGRLVDSMAKTRSAGCAAYMAPERIEPDPQNPDYDVRADVWSLGITLVEMATGVFPYQDCKTDFEVLTKVIGQDPPSLPQDKEFTTEFREFVSCCLKKDKKHRPKYKQLKNQPFIKKYEVTDDVNVGEWYVKLLQSSEDDTNMAAPRYVASPNSATNTIRQFFTSHQWQTPATQPSAKQLFMRNGTTVPKKQTDTKDSDNKVSHISRLCNFQRESQHLASRRQDFCSDSSSNSKIFSPYQTHQNHVTSLKEQLEDKCKQDKACCSPLPTRRPLDSSADAAYQHRRVASETRWRSPSSSPLPLRSQFKTDDQQYNCGNTSPIILQRFYHQQKQQQLVKEAEESGKKRFASYIKLQLGGDRSGKSSRHQSPEPPPRLNRQPSGDNQSPLAMRRTFLENHSANSPSLSRRYISPSPPVPPPRRLSESTSVPGSPQHLRARFRYTPEPQRRLFQNHDIS